MPIAWLANRDVILSLTFGALGLYAYLAWRERSRTRDAALATAAFSMSLLAGEYGLCFLGYALARELVQRGTSTAAIAERALGLVPAALPGVGYLAVRGLLGYGSEGSGFYADPFHAPIPFSWLAPRRLVVLLADAWLALDPDTMGWEIPTYVVLGGIAIGAAVVIVALRRALLRSSESERRSVWWLLLGSLFALVPVLAVVPAPRLLGAGMFGVAAAVGVILEAAWFPRELPARRGVADVGALAALVLSFSHFVHGPVTAWLTGRHYHETSVVFAERAATLRDRIGEDLDGARVVSMRGMGAAFFTPFALDRAGRTPARFHVLAHSGHVLVIRRGERTLDVVAPLEGGLFPWGEGNLFLDAGWRVAAGDVFEVPGLRATVLDVVEGRTRVVQFELERDFDEYVWVNEGAEEYVEGEPPAMGLGRPFDP
jgi:hypothetical protein